MSATQQVITIDDISADNAPAIYGHNSLHRYVEIARQSIVDEAPELSTLKGRKRIAHLAAEVARSKTAVDKAGRAYLKRLKEMTTPIEAELRVFGAEMDALRDEVRKPLDDWQAAEDKRIDDHNDAIDAISVLSANLDDRSAEALTLLLEAAEAVVISKLWEEFEADAARTKDAVVTKLRLALAARTKHEAELAAIAKFNAEQAIREQQERDAAIARAAVEQAQREAAEAAQAERDAAAKREQALIEQAAQAQRDSDQKARDAEAAAANQALQLQLAAEQAERLRLQAEADRVADAQRAEQQRIAAEQRQAQAVEQARLAEIARQEQAAAEERRQAEAREADKAHKAKINRAALDAFIAAGMPEECAKQAVTLIAQRKIPAVTISY